MANDLKPIEFQFGDSKYKKRMMSMLQDLEKSIPKTEGLNTSTYIAGGVGIAKALTGIAGMFTDAPQIKSDYKSTYQTDPNLKGAANYAMSKAVSNTDDYAGRIRMRNQRIGQTLSAVGNSGGDRNFVAANEAAARDIENIGNLTLDKQLSEQNTQKLNAASNLQQMALYDRLNESRSEMDAAELNFKTNTYNNQEKSRHIQGATSLITSGLNDITGAAGQEIQSDAMGNLQRMQIANVMGKYFGESEDPKAPIKLSPIDGYKGTTVKNIDPNLVTPLVPEGNNEENTLNKLLSEEQSKENKKSFFETSARPAKIKFNKFGSQYSPIDYSFLK